MSGEYLLIGGSRDGQRVTTERFCPVLELPMEHNSYPETEAYRAMAVLDQGEAHMIYCIVGMTFDEAIRRLIAGYRKPFS